MADNRAASSCGVVLLSPLGLVRCSERARDPRIVVEGSVPAKLMLAKPAALVSQRPRCRDPRPVRANVALDFNRVALSLAYYCDEGTLLMRHSTFAHPQHSTRRPNVGLRHKCCFVACARALSALRDDGPTLCCDIAEAGDGSELVADAGLFVTLPSYNCETPDRRRCQLSAHFH
jgi:hypothetical protein